MFGFFNKRVAALRDELERLTSLNEQLKNRNVGISDANTDLKQRNSSLSIAHTNLWAAHAAILEGATANPNGTVKKFLKISEQALIDDHISDVQPERRWSK